MIVNILAILLSVAIPALVDSISQDIAIFGALGTITVVTIVGFLAAFNRLSAEPNVTKGEMRKSFAITIIMIYLLVLSLNMTDLISLPEDSTIFENFSTVVIAVIVFYFGGRVVQQAFKLKSSADKESFEIKMAEVKAAAQEVVTKAAAQEVVTKAAAQEVVTKAVEETSRSKSCIISESSPDHQTENKISYSDEGGFGPAHREIDEEKWNKAEVTYALIKGTEDIRGNSDSTEMTAMNLAMLTWGLEISSLKLKRVNKDENPDITVSFKQSDEDDYLKDHKRILGYAYPPSHTKKGILVINDDYYWTLTGEPVPAWMIDPIHYSMDSEQKLKTWNLTSTLIHELGHTLGMPHIDDCPECIMYTKDNSNVDLNDKEIAIIRSKYGNSSKSDADYKRWKEFLKVRIRRYRESE